MSSYNTINKRLINMYHTYRKQTKGFKVRCKWVNMLWKANNQASTETGGRWDREACRADTAERCTDVFLANKHSGGEIPCRSNSRPPAPVWRIYSRHRSGPAGIDTWWYNHIFLLDAASAARRARGDEMRVFKWKQVSKRRPGLLKWHLCSEMQQE